jgi:hypothetical protein
MDGKAAKDNGGIGNGEPIMSTTPVDKVWRYFNSEYISLCSPYA